MPDPNIYYRTRIFRHSDRHAARDRRTPSSGRKKNRLQDQWRVFLLPAGAAACGGRDQRPLHTDPRRHHGDLPSGTAENRHSKTSGIKLSRGLLRAFATAPYLSPALACIIKRDLQKQISFYYGAGDEARTRYLHLGKVALYRMSYTRGTGLIIAEFSKMSSLFYGSSEISLAAVPQAGKAE